MTERRDLETPPPDDTPVDEEEGREWIDRARRALKAKNAEKTK